MSVENINLYEDINVSNARNSIHQIKSNLSYIDEDLDDEKQWRLSHLKKTFHDLDLKDLFTRYTDRLNGAFFALLMLLQTGLFATHILTIAIASKDDLSESTMDFVLYGLVTCMSFGLYIITDFYTDLKPKVLLVFTIAVFMVLSLSNLLIPIVYFAMDSTVRLRPAYTIHIIISCYVFLHFHPSILYNITLGLITTTTHILILIFITYIDSSMLTQRIISDTMFLISVNGLGIYYRYLTEIIKRKSFLDRRACVICNGQLKYEKDQEEHLMSNIIPNYVIDEVREDILQYWHLLEEANTESSKKSFKLRNDFTQSYPNVTILYADIVNYTEMTSKLNINELLETLNELFGQFDEASEKLNVLRIKFLGDCYYCVAGLPLNPVDNHAEACVDLGLRMIKIIAGIRDARKLDVNMRIGIHSGKVISGIIGHQKWQFDVWSKDVDIANKMESEGSAGMVHITEQTKNLLGKTYEMIPTNKHETVQQFKENGIKTFLISPKIEENHVKIEKKQDFLSIISELSESDDGNSNEEHQHNRVTNEFNPRNERRVTFFKKNEKPINNATNTDNYLPERERTPNSNSVSYYGIIEAAYDEYSTDTVKKSVTIPKGRQSEILKKRNEDRKITPSESKRRTAFMNSNIKRYKENLIQTNTEMEDVITNLSLSKFQQWFKFKDINPLTLFFKKLDYEKRFFKVQDPLFKYYVLSVVFLIIFLFVIQNITSRKWNWEAWETYITLGITVIVFLPLTWTYYLWSKYVKRDDRKLPEQMLLKLYYNASNVIPSNIWARLSIYTIVCVLFTLCTLSEWIDCINHESSTAHDQRNFVRLLISKDHTECMIPWHMTQTCALAIVMSFLFLRIFVWMKFIYASAITILYSYCIWNFSSEIFQNTETFNKALSPQISHTMSVVFLTFTLHMIDRQSEYMNRLDFLWNENVKEEQSKVKNVYIINKMLLNNILPKHVADMYLNINRPVGELYHEKYANVAVMFASIVGYQVEHIEEKLLLTIMNEIICDFDKLIMRGNYERPIEKIKVAKWTYMAACGISPGLGEDDLFNPPKQVKALLDFAVAMMSKLAEINREQQQEFKLRIGISNGEIVAGVVGSKKPLYDIWGDPVNMASRMDTTGLPDKIQVLKHTAQIIEELGFKCTYRDKIFVKGKDHPLPTYFLDLSNNYKLINKVG